MRIYIITADNKNFRLIYIMESSALEVLHIDPRMYKFICQQAITNIEDALVELITNSIDAYSKVDKEVNIIDINLDYTTRILSVVDYALGMTEQEMIEKLFYVGRRTNTGTRGYFSRGAKDICALGNVEFESVKDNNYSKCFINSNGECGVLVHSTPLSNKESISNYMKVSLQLKEFIRVDNVIENLQKHCALRDILHLSKNIIKFNNIQLKYNFPNGELICDIEYNIPGYPDALARFMLYKSPDPIPEPSVERFLEYGILVSSKYAIHESSCLYSILRHNPAMPHLFGTLKCEYIDKLMEEIEAGETAKNPFPIVDHSRINGLNRAHPFTQALFSLPYQRISYVLNQINEQAQNPVSQPDQIKDLLRNIELFGTSLFKETGLPNDWGTGRGKIAKVITSQAKKHIVKENQELSASSHKIKQELTEITDAGSKLLGFKIQIINEPDCYRYRLFRYSTAIILQINESDIAIKKFLKYGWESSSIKILIAEIITEALTRNILEFELIDQKKSNIDFAGMGNLDIITTIFKKYETLSLKIKNAIYDIIIVE